MSEKMEIDAIAREMIRRESVCIEWGASAEKSVELATETLQDVYQRGVKHGRLEMQAEVAALTAEIRREWWLNHGHTGMYGDDGEMQCNMCAPFGFYDWKREPFEKLAEMVPLIRAARAAQKPKEQPSAPPAEATEAQEKMTKAERAMYDCEG